MRELRWFLKKKKKRGIGENYDKYAGLLIIATNVRHVTMCFIF